MICQVCFVAALVCELVPRSYVYIFIDLARKTLIFIHEYEWHLEYQNIFPDVSRKMLYKKQRWPLKNFALYSAPFVPAVLVVLLVFAGLMDHCVAIRQIPGSNN